MDGPSENSERNPFNRAHFVIPTEAGLRGHGCRSEHSFSEWPGGQAAEPVLDLIGELPRIIHGRCSCSSFPRASGGNPVSFALDFLSAKAKSLDSRQKRAGMTGNPAPLLFPVIPVQAGIHELSLFHTTQGKGNVLGFPRSRE
jgi:hypothetical protein